MSLIEQWKHIQSVEADVAYYNGNEKAGYAEIARLKAKFADEAGPQLEAMQAEIEKLRQIISDCATALDSGAMIRPDATLDFMGYLPDEIRLRVQKLKASHSQESAK